MEATLLTSYLARGINASVLLSSCGKVKFMAMSRRNTPNKKLQADVSRGVHLHEYSYLVFYHANGPRMKRG